MDAADRAAEQADVLDEAMLRRRPAVSQRWRPGTDCLSCGEPIDPRRLAVLPNCCLCIDCQQDAERTMR